VLPSLRFLKLLALGLVPALLSAGSPAFYYLTVLYGVGLGLLFFADYFLGLNPRNVTVTRTLLGRFSLGEANRVQLRVRNFSRTRVWVTLTDDFPVSFAVKDDRLSGEIPPFGEKVFEYRVTPPQRGVYEFGNVHVRLESGLRLATRQRGRQQFYRCLDLLSAVKPALCHVNYKAALQHLALRHKRRSLVVIFTDLLDEETSKELVEYIRLLRPTHLPLCVTLNDANIVALTETVPHETADVYARTAALEMLNERKRLLDSLTQQGVLVLDRTPEEISVAAVNRYLELKARQVI